MGEHCKGPGDGQLEGEGQLQGKRVEKEGCELLSSSCLSLVVRLGLEARNGFCSFLNLSILTMRSGILKEPSNCLCIVFLRGAVSCTMFLRE